MGRLGDYLQFPEPDPDEQWAGIASRRRARARARRWRNLVAVAALFGAVAVMLVPVLQRSARLDPIGAARVAAMRFAPAADWAWERWPSASAEATVLRLADGSTVRAVAGSRVDVCRARAIDDCVALGRGTATISAQPRKRGMLRVRAGRVEVRVIGTRFTVERDLSPEHDRVRVEVEEGRVEVSADGRAVQVLGAGESWSLSTQRRGPSSARPHDPWGEAQKLSREGRHREAAKAYAEFIARNPKDSRVPLAALELGRIRMDALSDPSGALAPLRRAARTPGTTQQDAQARWVRALEALGRHEECMQQREAYMQRFPHGVHRRAMERACRRPHDQGD